MNKEMIDALGTFFAGFTIVCCVLLSVIGVAILAVSFGPVKVLAACVVVGILITGTLAYLYDKCDR